MDCAWHVEWCLAWNSQPPVCNAGALPLSCPQPPSHLFSLLVFFPLIYIPRNGIAGSYGNLCGIGLGGRGESMPGGTPEPTHSSVLGGCSRVKAWISWGTLALLSVPVKPVSIPTNSTQGGPFLHVLVGVFLWWRGQVAPTVVGFFLVRSDSEHLCVSGSHLSLLVPFFSCLPYGFAFECLHSLGTWNIEPCWVVKRVFLPFCWCCPIYYSFCCMETFCVR